SVSIARGDRTADPGAVHLNCALTEPLVPDANDDSWPEPLGPRDGPWTTVHPAVAPAAAIQPGPRTVVVAGDSASQAARVAAETGRWPLFAEPSSRSPLGLAGIPSFRLVV